jgi:hypothetical protein
MRERPILFNGEMVNAILDGRKTMTRRIMKYDHFVPKRMQTDYDFETFIRINPAYFAKDMLGECCPYGSIGDRLWVRETWQPLPDMHPEEARGAVYRATDSDWVKTPWKPSIFMPRWASRITLEITDVRVERLQDITFDDVNAEGIDTRDRFTSWAVPFIELWNEINGKKYPWDSNPWLWVVSFKSV